MTSKQIRGTLAAGVKSGNKLEYKLVYIVLYNRTTLGISALPMAASTTEDSIVRTKTAIPDYWTWGIARPFPRSHIKCQIPIHMWYMGGKTSTNLVV